MGAVEVMHMRLRSARYLLLAVPLAAGGCADLGGGGGFPVYPGGLGSSGYHGSSPNYGSSRSRDRFEPRPGVVCDAGERVCYDRRGPDVGLTGEYFGSKASKRLADDLDRRRKDPVYRPKEKVRCNLDDELCLKKGVPDYANTREQFGRKAALKVRQPGWDDDEIRPNRKVVCDTGEEACYKRDGKPAIGATKKVFGKKAARELKKDTE